MKRLVLLLLLFLGAAGCTAEDPGLPVSALDYVLQELMETDAALNESMEYIAVDVSGTNLQETELLSASLEENWETDTFFSSLDELQENAEAEAEREGDLTGVSLAVTDITYEGDNTWLIDTVKHRSRDGAVGIAYTIEEDGGSWIIVDEQLLWVA
ncbi:hypothetical protein [Alkalicoccus chagannorensis]|uniref:hypothetical protein n=1 Tax=Alkalicoccus chagannorensis TaxID=427072 RepID=UPI000422318D|nr:hypothetical protein [Alkalicoccus chagannorensis]